MTEDLDTIQLLAELALGLGGFAGVAAAFAGRDRVFRPMERIRFLSILLTSGSTLAGCVLILTLHTADVAPAVIMRVVAGAGLLTTAALYVPQIVLVFRHYSDPDSTSEAWAVGLAVVHVALTSGLFAYQLFQVDSVWPLVAAFSQMLVWGVFMFARLLLRPN